MSVSAIISDKEINGLTASEKFNKLKGIQNESLFLFMTNETISIGVTLGSKHVFHLRLIGITAEQELRQKTFGLSDQEISETEYERNASLLADLSEKMPEGLFPNSPKERSEDDSAIYIESFTKPSEAVRAFFADKSVSKERIAYFAVRAFFVKLTPDIDFN
jgi:hypothetical protein